MKSNRAQYRVAAAAIAVSYSAMSMAQIIDPDFASDYTLDVLGSPAGVPANYGGLCLKRGDTNTLLLGGAANNSDGKIYQVKVVRDAGGHIVGFDGPAQVFVVGDYNDGGVCYNLSQTVLFCSRWPVNGLNQFRVGDYDAGKVIDLNDFGMATSHAALNFLPPEYGALAGRPRFVSWAVGQFYSGIFTADGQGTFDLSDVLHETTIEGGPEGFVYVPPGSALFNHSMLVSEYSNGQVTTYEADAAGIPILPTRRVFVDQLSGAEGAFVDPVTGDFLFSTFGGQNIVVAVRGFTAPATIAGTVNLLEYIGDVGTQVVTIEVRNVGETIPQETLQAQLSSTGTFNVLTAMSPGDYDITIKGKHWLRKLQSDILLGTSGVQGLEFTLSNGDIDGDNSVTLLDYDIFSEYFDKTSSDSDWLTPGSNGFAPADADLDGDNMVTLLDYDVFSNNYDTVGDN